MKKLNKAIAKTTTILGLALTIIINPYITLAATVTLDPTDDGSIYFPDPSGVNTTNYLLASGSIRGVVEFSLNQISAPIAQAFLSVNPYGLPLFGNPVDVYAYESYDGLLTSSDYDAGTFLGSWLLPSDLNYGQDAFFEVTQFLQTLSSPFVGFNLRTAPGGTDVFSSLEYNYGHPSQLTITTIATPIPEPSSVLGFLALGTLGAASALKRKLKSSKSAEKEPTKVG